ncbi:hypothetical protein BH10PSE7_BH10PSE7_17510 [soil metagenome]
MPYTITYQSVDGIRKLGAPTANRALEDWLYAGLFDPSLHAVIHKVGIVGEISRDQLRNFAAQEDRPDKLYWFGENVGLEPSRR